MYLICRQHPQNHLTSKVEGFLGITQGSKWRHGAIIDQFLSTGTSLPATMGNTRTWSIIRPPSRSSFSWVLHSPSFSPVIHYNHIPISILGWHIYFTFQAILPTLYDIFHQICPNLVLNNSLIGITYIIIKMWGKNPRNKYGKWLLFAST
jgi:hypothetical protein